MEKYGFIYLWYDKKRKMFYLGCHWGSVDDGYICSSNRMRDAYRRRPNDFRRRILKIVEEKENLLEEEYAWLQHINDNELGKKYYNLHKHHFGHWSVKTDKWISVREKLRGNKNRLGKPKSLDECAKISKGLTGKKRTIESRRRQAESLRGYKQSHEHIQNKINSNKGKKREVITCPHCQKNGGINMMKRWHMSNCRFKEDIR